MAFLKYHGQKYKGIETIHSVMGRRGDPREVARERCIVLRNCAAKLRDMGIFLKGCPPIPSDILNALSGLEHKERCQTPNSFASAEHDTADKRGRN